MININKKLSTYFYFLVYKLSQHFSPLKQLIRSKPCLLCLEPTENYLKLCTACLVDLPDNNHCCHRCALPLPNSLPACGECISDPPPFTRTIANFRYRFPIDRLIQYIKYEHKRFYTQPLSSLLADQIKLTYNKVDLPEVMIPVPVHAKKKRQRGYNQSELIAKELYKQLDIPIDKTTLLKTKETKAQTTLDKKKRKRNLKSTFRVKEHHYDYIALVDDVMTTRATTETLAKLLLNSGAKRVDVWCIARTPKRRLE